MVPRGLEPRTLRLLAVRSNQLSYETSVTPCRQSTYNLITCASTRNSLDVLRTGYETHPQGHLQDSLAERSKAVAQGAIPKGRGFEPHRRQFSYVFAKLSSGKHSGWRLRRKTKKTWGSTFLSRASIAQWQSVSLVN